MTDTPFLKRSIVFAVSTSLIAVVVLAVSARAQRGTAASNYSVRTLPLPDNGTGDVSMDYIAFDPTTNSLWVPGGNTGAVDVVDTTTGAVRQISNLPRSGFKTASSRSKRRPDRGRTRTSTGGVRGGRAAAESFRAKQRFVRFASDAGTGAGGGHPQTVCAGSNCGRE